MKYFNSLLNGWKEKGMQIQNGGIVSKDEPVNYAMKSEDLRGPSGVGFGFPTSDEMRSILVSPKLAEAWLERNTKNRPLKNGVVRNYARDMMHGQWKVTGDTIKFDRNGVLIDGQHRLRAIILSKVSVRTDVRFGLDPEVFINIDSHAKRVAADFLAIRGETNAKSLAGGISNIIHYDRKFFGSIGRNIHTNDEIGDYLIRYPAIRESVEPALKVKNLLAPSIGIALHYLASRVDKNKTNLFFQRLADGLDLSADDPIYLLRERLIAERVASPKRGSLRANEFMALGIKAFNASVEGRSMKALKWMSNRVSGAEEFPTFPG